MKLSATFIPGMMLLFMSVACSVQEEDKSKDQQLAQNELCFTAEFGEIDTKTAFQADETSIWWSPADEICIYYGASGGSKFTSTNTVEVSKAQFRGNLSAFTGESESGDFNYFMALYPYSAAMGCDGEYIEANLSGQQVAKAGSFAPNTNISLAKNLGLSLSFFNVCSWFRFSVTKEGVKWVIFRGNNDEDVTGKFRVSMGEDNRPTAPEVIEGKKEITLHLPDYEPFEVGKIYYITLFPQVFTKGFTVTFKTDTEIATRSISAKATFLRSKYNSGIGFDSPEKGVVYTEDPNAENLSGGVEGGTESGLYLGLTYFGSSLSNYPAQLLTEESISGFNTFIDNRTDLDDETLLYYTVDKSMSRLQSNRFPDDLFSVAIVTFTDGQDDGSVGWKEDETGRTYYKGDYERELAEILEGTVQNVSVMAYSVGLKQAGVSSNTAFINSLQTIAHPSSNYTLANNMSEVNERFRAIAQELSNTIKLQKLIGTIPRQATGTRIRFTYDNIQSGANSSLYIEGVYYSTDYSLRNVVYHGLTSTSGTTVVGVRNKNKVTFTFEGVHRENNVDVNMDYFKRWIYNTDTSEWEEYIETSFQPGENGIVREMKSAAIILNLDCTESLGSSNFNLLKQYSKNFINTLFTSSIDPEAVQRVTLNKSALALAIGSSQQLIATVSPSTAIEKSISWTSSNPSVVSVDENGTVHALAEGTATITVTTTDGGKTASCVVTAFIPVSSISVNSSTTDLMVGDIILLNATLTPNNATYQQVNWTSSDANIASVDNQGVVTAKKGGAVTISATTTDGTNLSSSCSLFVNQHVSGIGLNVSSARLCLQDTRALSPVFTPADATYTNVSWSSSNNAIATVSQGGVVQAISAGVVEITVTAEDGGYEATCSIEVVPAIDLGLSVCWATYNVGGSKPEDYGYYYAWGETTTKSNYAISNYKWFNYVNDNNITIKKYNANSNWGSVDNKWSLDLSDDAAYVNKGNSWRMPSSYEWGELIDNCDWEWRSQGGHYGYLVTSRKAGYTDKKIFLPASGAYENTSLQYCGSYLLYWANNHYNSVNAYALTGNSTAHNLQQHPGRFLGCTVRAVLIPQ